VSVGGLPPEDGAEALVHANRGLRIHKSLPATECAAVVKLAGDGYAGANYSHLTELPRGREGVDLSLSTVRRILLKAGPGCPLKSLFLPGVALETCIHLPALAGLTQPKRHIPRRAVPYPRMTTFVPAVTIAGNISWKQRSQRGEDRFQACPYTPQLPEM